MNSFGLGFHNNAYAFTYQTNKLKNDHRKLVLTVHLYTNGHLEPVYHQPLTRADMSMLNLSITKTKTLVDLLSSNFF